MSDPLTLMHWQTAALYTTNAAGRLTGINEMGNTDPAPRFFLGRTPAGNIWQLRADVPDELAAKLDALCRQEPPLKLGQNTPPTIAPDVYRLLGAGAGEYRGPAYVLPTPQPLVTAATQVPDVVPLSGEMLDVMRPHFPAFLERDFASRIGPIVMVLVGGEAVALCTCARLTLQVAEAGIRTAPAFRGRGYAAAAAALWANLVAASGRVPLYSTTWENVASQKVAVRLGAVQYGEDWSVA